jgi:di/tricarboxylate transporter
LSHSTITFLVLAAVVVVFTLDRAPVAIVAIGTALALWATGVLDLNQALAGFGDPTVLFIGSLFVVSEALDASGVTAWAGQTLIAQVGESRTRLIVLMSLLVAGLTALINVNGAVAALVPVVVVMALRLKRRPAQLLMPLAFAAHAGSLLALTGTPVNVIVSESAKDAGVGAFGFFSFALVGLPLLVGTVAIILLFGKRLLPERRPRASSRNFSEHARTLVESYALDDDPESLLTRRSGVAEIVIPPRSELIGELAYPGMVTDSGDLVVLAVKRGGEALEPVDSVLAAGDSLLLQGSWGALEYHLDDPSVLLVDSPDAVRRQTVPLGLGAWESIGVLVAMVVLLATGALPPAVAGLLAAGALVLLRVLTVDQAYRGISWTTVILVGGMISLSTAMTESGAAQKLANELVRIVGGHGGYALLAGLFVLTAALGQLISNMATALIVIPISLSAAHDVGVSPKPVLMCVCVSAAAAFLTPVATLANLMVMGPAGYRFGDYWKLGLPLLLLFGAVAIFLVPVFWSF